MDYQQTDCFKTNMKFWRFLGISIEESPFHFYKLYSIIIVFTFVILYDSLCTINFYFLPKQLDAIIEEIIFFFMEMSVVSRVLTFIVLRKKIAKLLEILERPIFKPNNDEEKKIIDGAKRFNQTYWKIVAVASVVSNLTHVSSPFITHLLLQNTLNLPVSSYSFLSPNTTQRFIYPLYLYQSVGMHFHVWYTVNIGSFFLGLMILIIAQLEILDLKLRTITDVEGKEGMNEKALLGAEDNSMAELRKCIIHYDEVGKFCSLVEDVFSATLFTQFSMGSCILCVCLFRFTLPAPFEYYIFLVTYMFVMTVQIFVPCWFGTRIMDKSAILSFAVYSCNWTVKPGQFKSNLRLFVERANKPMSITGGKMFTLSLSTFTSIMNSAYSFFTLLRHMQSRQS